MESRLIICFFIVGLQRLCGMLFFSRFGLCWVMPSRSFLLAGGRVATRGVRLFGKWFLFALCGIFGGSVMALRTSRGLMKSYSIFFPFTLFTWTAGWLAPRVISFVDFLSLFSSPPSPLCIPPVYQGLRSSALLIYSTDSSKKKKKTPALHYVKFY
jgi:hypothetical protein